MKPLARTVFVILAVYAGVVLVSLFLAGLLVWGAAESLGNLLRVIL